jgi:stage IV sporulation protein FB
MKSIKAKFKINSFTYVLILTALLTGFIKNISLILLIVIFHECGHIFLLKHYEYEIEKVEIYPFGGITKVKKPINTPLKKEVMIALAGVFFQILLFFLFTFFSSKGIIRENTYHLFVVYNKSILLFNLLPIIPLDGSIIVHSCLEYFFPYQKAYFGYLITSSLVFFAFLIAHTLKSLNNYMILTFLLFKIYDAYKKRSYYENRFFLERYLYDYPYIKIESHPYPDLTKLKKDTLHFFWKKDRYLHEKEFLKQKFKN